MIKWHQLCYWDNTPVRGTTDFMKEEKEQCLGNEGGQLVLYSLDAKISLLYLITTLLLSCHHCNGQVASS